MNELLMIPGPVEFEPAVLQAMATKTPSHISPDFIEVFGHSFRFDLAPFIQVKEPVVALKDIGGTCNTPGTQGSTQDPTPCGKTRLHPLYQTSINKALGVTRSLAVHNTEGISYLFLTPIQDLGRGCRCTKGTAGCCPYP